MAKKRPSLEQLTQWRCGYAAVALAGVVIRRSTMRKWYIDAMPEGISFIRGPYVSRQEAVQYAQRKLESK
jgi:hypothetical protein